MAVYLLFWGDPTKEAREDQEIQFTWQNSGETVYHTAQWVNDPDPEKLRLALKGAIEHPETSIVYLSSHGDTTGLVFSDGTTTIPYKTLSRWLHDLTPQIDPRDVGYGDRWLVLGFCEAMHSSVIIEFLMPSWIVFVAGFLGKPQAQEAAQLLAGIVTNLREWHDATWMAVGEDTSVPEPGETSWEHMERVFNRSAAAAPNNPARNVHLLVRHNVVIARRDPDTGQWTREYGQ